MNGDRRGRRLIDTLMFDAGMRLWSLLARIPFTPQHREREHILDRLLGRQQAELAKLASCLLLLLADAR